MSGKIDQLAKFFNGGCLHRSDIVASLVTRNYPFRKNAPGIQEVHRVLKNTTEQKSVRQFRVEPYQGKNPFVLEMKKYLLSTIQDELIDAVVHGSLGTGEEMQYSDFDGLVIIKDEVFNDMERLIHIAKVLSESQRIMFQMDPLQHHGWFVLTESMMNDYPVTYFPPEIFSHARTLIHANGFEYNIRFSDAVDFIKPFTRLADSLEYKLSIPAFNRNAYFFKSLLSEFMLLPAMYVQARDHHGVFKKFSFDMARQDFTEAEWKAMDVISEIRNSWNFRPKGIYKYISVSTHPIALLIKKKYFPAYRNIHEERKQELVAEMSGFIRMMKNKLSVSEE